MCEACGESQEALGASSSWAQRLPKSFQFVLGQVWGVALVSEGARRDPENTLAQAFGPVPGYLSCSS